MGRVTIGRLIAPVLLAGALVACSSSGRSGTVPAKSIDDVLAAHADSLLALPGVVGTAIGLCEGERCIKVFVADSYPHSKARIPLRLEGYRVVVEVTSTIRPL